MLELITPRLKLRDFREDDFEALYAIDSDVRVCRYESGPLTAEQVRYRLEGALEWAQETPRRIYKLAITVRPDDRARGRLSLKLVDPDARAWEIGWTLHPQAWGHGYATEAAGALLRYAFGELRAHRVSASCHADNAASWRMMERLGMQREGRLRHTLYLNGAWYDELVYGILEGEMVRL